jgi:hypothetical protein
MQSQLLLLTASLNKTLQTLKSKQSEVGTSFVKYTVTVFSQIKSPAIRSHPGNDFVKKTSVLIPLKDF